MISYYGSKTNLVKLYPPPKHDIIIEPFAGFAKYSFHYFEKNIILIDKYPVIINIWKWLQQCSPNDILSLPRDIKAGQLLENMTFDCQEQKDFYGFIIGCGAERPRLTAGKRKTSQRPNSVNYNLNRVARNLFKIKHWDIRHGSYEAAPEIKATWFIDPPYQFGGQSYVFNNKKIDWPQLADWCRSRAARVPDKLSFAKILKQTGWNSSL